MRCLEQLEPQNHFAALPPVFYSAHVPQGLEKQFHIHTNHRVAEQLGIDPEQFKRSDSVELLTNRVSELGFEPIAACYAGHQFGQYVPRLGDGRAILIGQVEHDGRQWDLQLKGAGRTLYSRQGDGKAVLRSTIREHLASTAMDGLGIPTTQSLALFGSHEKVYRESVETGAMLIRVAPSHIRFGSFEYYYYTQRTDDLRVLFDYTIKQFFPSVAHSDNPVIEFLREVTISTAVLIAQWQSVGFCHGVMNTDNMSVHGLTIDYGPYGFMDQFKSGHICNHSDYAGRYAFSQQPRIGLFNLSCLAQALVPLAHDVVEEAVELATDVLNTYAKTYESASLDLKRNKLGLMQHKDEDGALYDQLLKIMEEEQLDFTNTFRWLSEFNADDVAHNSQLHRSLGSWLESYRQRLQQESVDTKERQRAMKASNPKFVLRNWMAENAIRDARDHASYTEIERLDALLASPFEDHPEIKNREDYCGSPPEWARNLSVSCSS
ncbi:MAG: YdiU family protein [Pseudomonadota bacterium]